jgi:ABC-type uncharacterized transport system permease subunit
MDLSVILQVLDSTVRLSTPLLLAALAGLFSERSGVFDIGLEGKMLGAAFAAGAAAAVFGSPWIGLLFAVLVGLVLALVHAFASITVKGNQIVSGVAINFIALGLTALLGQSWFARGGRTPQLSQEQRFSPMELPGSEALADVPILGPIYADLISGHNLIVYFAFFMVPVTYWIVFKTRFGLRLRAVGENPAAVDTAGISVVWARYRAVMICGVLCGFAGAYLSIGQQAGFVQNMTAGKGFIALAALIFARWKPLNAMYACLLFGFLDAVAIRMQGAEFPIIGTVNSQLMQALPYILTVILLAGFIGKAVPPKAGGVAYTKER